MVSIFLITLTIGVDPNGAPAERGVIQLAPPAEEIQPPEIRRLPPTVENSRSNTRTLDLHEALLTAVNNNKSIAVARYVPRSSATGVIDAESVFDPVLSAGANWSQSSTELASTVDVAGTGSANQKLSSFGAGGPSRIGLSKLLRTGGTISADVSTSTTSQFPVGTFTALNPSWRSVANFRVQQPLFNRPGENNRLPITIAQANLQQSRLDFQASVNALFLEVETAYWQLAITAGEVEVQQAAMAYAKKVYDKELEKFKLEESSRPAVSQASESYQRSRLALLQSQNGLLQAERQLRQSLGLPGFDGQRIVLPDKIDPLDYELDWETAVSNTISLRPEIAAQRQAISAARADYRLAQNLARPDVNVVADYSMPGLAGNFGRSLNKMFNDGTYQWMMSLEVNRPIGNRMAKNNANRARLEFNRQRAVLEQLEFDLVHELQAAYQQVIADEQAATAAIELRKAAAVRLEAAEEFYDLGGENIDLLLRARSAFTDSQIAERQAILRLRIAITNWLYSQGTLRENRLFVVAD